MVGLEQQLNKPVDLSSSNFKNLGGHMAVIV